MLCIITIKLELLICRATSQYFDTTLHAVMRVKVPFTDLTLSPDRSHSCTFVTAEVKYRNRSGKPRQLFAILSRIFCYREKQNGPIVACQSTITLFCCSEVDQEIEESPGF